jgi:fluoride exporter
MLAPLLVALGAALGAPSRYLVDRTVQSWHDMLYPFGTLLINLLGSGVLGLLIGLASGPGLPNGVLVAAGTGWCGAFTTYSTFGFEAVQLGRDGLPLRAIGYVAVSVLGGLALAALGVLGGQGIG